MNITRSILIIPLAALLLSGCATHQRSEYAAFAQAGSEYAQAIDKVLVAAGETQVDYTSWTLAKRKHTFGQVDDGSYDKYTEEDKRLREAFQRLQKHADLLEAYFSQLESLATSDSPIKTKEAINETAEQVSTLSSALRVDFPNLPGLDEVVVLGTELKIRAALKEHLETKKELIREALLVHQELLSMLAENISKQLTYIRDIKEKLLVRTPITNKFPLARPEVWVAHRREAIDPTLKAEEVIKAAEAAKKINKLFDDLLEGKKDTRDMINALIKDIKSIRPVMDAFK